MRILKYTFISISLIFLSCNLKERIFENDFLSILIPKDWIITEKNNEKDSRWLVTNLIPKDSKFYNDENLESPSQNLIISVKDSSIAYQNGNDSLSNYARDYHKYQKSKYNNVSNFQTKSLSSKMAYYWERKIEEENKQGLIQKIHIVTVGKFYVSIITTSRSNGTASDLERMLASIKFKQ